MRKLVYWAAMVAMAALAFSAAAEEAARKKTVAKKGTTSTSAKKSSGTAKKGSTSASSRRRTTSKRPTATWRTRQTAPTQERYKEIQQALASKGYLKPEEANGSWGQASVDALKHFQAEQKLEPSGKINSLSLIALGLGPKRETAAAPKPAAPTPDQPESGK